MPRSRPLPKETIEGLLPPPSDFPYFAGSDVVRFQPTAPAASVSSTGSFQDVNAWWLADASTLVYGDAAFVESRFDQSPLPGLGFTIDWIRDGDDIRGMVLSAADVLVVVFRGTKVLLPGLSGSDSPNVIDMIVGNEDLKIDSRLLPAASRAGGFVHSGFLDAYARISGRLDEVFKARRAEQKLWLAGHSLGGALAVLALAHLADDGPIEGVYTYGCPRVGDRAFVDSLPRCVHRRFVHRDDVVARIPTSWPFAYVDAGEFQAVPDVSPRALLSDLNEGFNNLASALKRSIEQKRLDVGAVPFSIGGLADHAPVYYATLLWNALAQGLNPD
ncbi:MAG: lipase family protein [Paludisphaera borealis]|uniref:lipase family protein n=1 Tax=Paludisphaera borealis TaxID=1387353 RepID=UPI00283B2CEC|nr:lipase family protein [Paludisphaera borealis]MDR3621832.1 lipase family protein [Paludisphaera borealis]